MTGPDHDHAHDHGPTPGADVSGRHERGAVERALSDHPSDSPIDTKQEVLLTTKDLLVGYDGKAILPKVDVSIEREELWALIGRNGQGKSTLLKTALGLLPAVSGEVRWKGGVKIGYVPQRAEIDLSVPQRVRDVVAMGLDRAWSFLSPFVGANAKRRDEQIMRVLEETNMASVANQPFAALSGGQQQRVLMSRALACDPDVLILDEPTNGMDVVAEHQAFELFTRLRTTRHLALVVVSHHMSFLATRASHVLWVDKTEQLVVFGTVRELREHKHFMEHWGAVFASTEQAHRRAATHAELPPSSESQ